MKSPTVRQNTMAKLATRIDREIGRVDRLHTQMSRLKDAVRLKEQGPGKKPPKSWQESQNPFDVLLA
jgi:hypothetical protein